ncbi:ATP-binding protein [Adlercreutzia aquisgranensis]|uniref:ATP-binding protein n=1 Tax=Adlercreutzia aquisgranensis TaxID=2941323 RepID=UPI00203B9448|nr:ATP-binding protein [Adlercreutzia aquisgranensis]
MAFVGRDQELSTLNGLYNCGGFQMVVIYGRRRVGKTALISHFAEGKPTIFFSARESTSKENLVALSQAIASLQPGGTPVARDTPSPVFASFEQAFAAVLSLARKQRIVFVIDEYPYLAQSDRSVSSILQHCIDAEKDRSQLFIVLCGSSMSFMEHQVLGYTSPLYGRRTAQIKVQPFSIMQAAQLLQGSSAEDIVTWYGITGGIPLYLSQWNSSMSMQQNIARNVLRTDSFLYGEPDAFLQQELREPSKYNAIIQAIANGEGKLSNIADVAGIERTMMANYLKGLEELGIVRQEKPIVDANRKKTRYVLADNLFRFWYRFVLRYLTPIEAGRTEEVAQLIVRNHLPTFTGPVFEEVCRQWLVYRPNRAEWPLILGIGRWWGTDPRMKEQAELDVVALCDDDTMICGECKWQAGPVGTDVLHKLSYRANIVRDGRKQQLVLFSKSGFTAECRTEAKQQGCTLVSMDDMGLA